MQIEERPKLSSPEMPMTGVQINTKNASVQKDLLFIPNVEPRGPHLNIGAAADGGFPKGRDLRITAS